MRAFHGTDGGEGEATLSGGGTPGKSTRTERLPPSHAPAVDAAPVQRQVATEHAVAGDDPFALHLADAGRGPVLREAEGAAPTEARPSDAAVAQAGFRGPATTFPDLGAVNASLGGDFSRVPVHTGPAAEAASRQLGANAYTHDGAVAFKSERPSVETQVHEATHLAQLGHVDVTTPLAGGASTSALEHEATAVAAGGKAEGQTGAAPRGGDRGEVLRQTDAGAESGTGVDAGISAGTMVADGINGQKYTVTVDGDYKVELAMTKAYKGTYPYRAASRDVKGVYVRIDGTFTDLKSTTSRCAKLQMLQVIRNTRTGTDGKLETADPTDATRRTRSGWGDSSAKSQGWRVDTATTSTEPNYTSSWVGNEGDATKPATIWDTPGDWSTTTNAGKDFQTSLVLVDTAGKKTVVATIHWGYMIDGSGTVAFSPSPPTVMKGNPVETKDAAERWDSISGNTKTGITF